MDRLLEFVANNWILFVALAATVLWISMSELTRLAHGVRQVEASEATRLYNREDAVFVDIRAEADFQKGHLPGAVSVPNGNINQRHKRLQKQKQKPIIVYCGNGMASGKAGKQLKNNGFEQVYQLKGGYSAWETANLPIESK
ncbi:MAG: rhodanese-like domain-containing protein [Aquisalimonadaceae bacterium]